MTAGNLNLDAPPAIGWAETVTGLDQQLSDPTPADEAYTVDDSTGTAAGWNVTASATAFTVVGSTPLLTLGTPGTTDVAAVPTFATNGAGPITAGGNGGTGLMTDTSAPTATCLTGSTCTPPTNTGLTGPVTYPVNITYGNAATGAASPGAPIGQQTTPVSIYNADAGSGTGTIVIGGATAANPIGWWINVPANTIQGTYTSTVSLELVSGP